MPNEKRTAGPSALDSVALASGATPVVNRSDDARIDIDHSGRRGASSDYATRRWTAAYAVRQKDGALWVTECAWCGRVKSAIGIWRVLSVRALEAIHAERTHGICPDCEKKCVGRAAAREMNR
jgi:hypothetical protein